MNMNMMGYGHGRVANKYKKNQERMKRGLLELPLSAAEPVSAIQIQLND
jgi:hypothetical protein